MAGAAPSPCWAAFTTHTQDNEVPDGRVRCNFCGGEMTRNATHMAGHLRSTKCRAAGNEAANGVQRAAVLAALDGFRGRSARKRPAASAAPGAVVKHSRQRTLCFARARATAEEANIALVNLLAAEALPLSLVESTHFRRFVNVLMRGVRTEKGKVWRVPCRQTVANTILPVAFNKIDAERRAKVLENVRDTGVTISVDGKTSKAQHTSLLNVESGPTGNAHHGSQRYNDRNGTELEGL